MISRSVGGLPNVWDDVEPRGAAECAPAEERNAALESGLVCLASLLSFHNIAADPAQLRHELGHGEDATGQDLLRISQRISGVRSRAIIADWAELKRVPLPALANGPDGWFIIGKVGSEGALLQGSNGQVLTIDQKQLEAIWSGELVLLKTLEIIDTESGRFDVSWFIPQIV